MTHGLRQIVRFNWPFYVAGSGAIVGALVLVVMTPLAGGLRLACAGAAALATFWLVASLAVSWIVYDRSHLTRWTWLAGLLVARPRRWINLHAGLDESTAALGQLLGTAGRVFDFFDARVMTESSIARARRTAPDVPAERVDFRHLPAPAGEADAAFLLLSAHELRRADDRRALFSELRRALAPDGRIVVAEHLRDLANFLAFGPGVLHFHSRRTWRRAFTQARLTVDRELSITPFVHVFVLRRMP